MSPVKTVMPDADINNAELRIAAVEAAQGKRPFDILITGGTVIDMVTGRLRKADIGLTGPLICSVHPPGEFNTASKTIDASERFISPGLIDMHLHIESSMITPAAYATQVLPRGVTTTVWDPHEFANTCGLAGMEYAMAAASTCPLRILTLVPSCVPSAPGFETTGADFTADIVASLLNRKETHGIGEVMSMQAVLDNDNRFHAIVQAGLDTGKRICGHARGLSGRQLNAYTAAGIETDHELTSAADLMEKLEAGLTIELRGSHDHLLPEFVEALNSLGCVPPTVTLCTDDVFIDDLLGKGGLDDVVRRLIKYGLDPVQTLRAATFNAANRLQRPDLGLIAAGKRADLVVFDNLLNFNATMTIANGQCIAQDGKLTRAIPEQPLPDALKNTVRSSEHWNATDFRVPSASSEVTVSVIEKPRFTAWGERQLPVREGYIDVPEDLVRMAIINRFKSGSRPSVAYLGQWGTWSGAFATTISHDSHNLTVFSGNEADMALAANTVAQMQGGLAVVRQGEILATLALPVAGLVSEKNAKSLAEDFRAIRRAMDQIADWQPPYLVFKACFGASLVCNAGPHLSDLGIVDTTLRHQQSTPIGTPP
ncbi:adenosine deaminase [Chromatiales bacterium (ex Bugula neritina AB1)]|nr:adenosine deaminase [Chromatiales bacterium (ex Bugula neritina AB1)]